MSSAAENRVSVVIVGAGLAGLTTAETLLYKRWGVPGAESLSYDVTLVEAASRVGGRTCSEASTLCPRVRVDTGGQWLGAQQSDIHDLAARLRVQLHPQFAAGRRVLQLGHAVSSYNGLVPNIAWTTLLDVQLVLLLVNMLVYAISCSRRGGCARLLCCGRRIHAWADGMSVEDISRRVMFTVAGRVLIAIVVQALFGVEPSQLSFAAMLEYIASSTHTRSVYPTRSSAVDGVPTCGCGAIDRMCEVGPGSVQAATVIGGAQQLSEALAQRVTSAGGRVNFNSRVVRVEYDSNRASTPCSVVCEDGSALACEVVVVCVPPAIASSWSFSPALPPHRVDLMHASSMGCIIKSLAIYPRAFWRDAGFSGEVIAADLPGQDAGPAFNVFDACIPIDELTLRALPSSIQPATYVDPVSGDSIPLLPALVVFINGDKARSSSGAADPESRRTAVLRQLGSWFGPAALQPLEYIEKDWVADPFTRGCPVSSVAAGALTRFGYARPLAEPCWTALCDGGSMHRLFWAGTETSEVDAGFMSGAVRSGLNAADGVVVTSKRMLAARRAGVVPTPVLVEASEAVAAAPLAVTAVDATVFSKEPLLE